MRYGIRPEHDMSDDKRRHYMTIWSGAFMSDYEGMAVSLPRRDGYMVTLHNGDKVRVTCPDLSDWGRVSGEDIRTAEGLISSALTEHYERRRAERDAAYAAVEDCAGLPTVRGDVSSYAHGGDRITVTTFPTVTLHICAAHLEGWGLEELATIRREHDARTN